MARARPTNTLTKPAEASERAWKAFTRALATTLSVLETDQHLVIVPKGAATEPGAAAPLVRITGHGAYGLRVDAVVADPAPLLATGWARVTDADTNEPATEPTDAVAETDTTATTAAAEAPPAFVDCMVEFAPPVDPTVVAEVASRALRDVLGIRHPSHLRYDAFDEDGAVILLPSLGLRRGPSLHDMTLTELEPGAIPLVMTPETTEELRAAVDQVLRTMFGGTEVVHDEDGDVPISFGSTNLYVRVIEDQPIVRLFVPLLVEVPESNDLYAALNEINGEYAYVRAHWADDLLVLTCDLPAFPFVGAHLVTTVTAIGRLADEIDDELQERLGGRLLLGTTVARPPREIGGYL